MIERPGSVCAAMAMAVEILLTVSVIVGSFRRQQDRSIIDENTAAAYGLADGVNLSSTLRGIIVAGEGLEPTTSWL